MTSTRTLFTLGLAIVALSIASIASAASPAGNSSLTIRHQTRGCHAWSLNHGAFKATQTVTMRRGSVLTVANDDVMPHALVLTRGPALLLAHASMRHMGAVTMVRFTRSGVYHFTTKAGEDYPGVTTKTIGEDNVLRLTVTVP